MTRGRAPTFALAGVAVAVLTAATFKIRSFDLFWHLEAGQWILAHRALPRTDPFRFTATGTPWTDHEWLAQVLLALAERPWGLVGLGVLRSLFVLALAGLVLASLRRMRAPWPEALLVVFAAIFLARRRFLLQPELATFAGIVCLLVLLEELRRRPRPGPAVAAILGTALWANAHPGALVAPVIAALHLGGQLLDARSRAIAPAPPRWLWLLPIALLAALVATPHGLAIFAVPGRIAAALDGLPVTNPEWEPLWRSPQPAFFVALVAVVAIVAWRWRRTACSIRPRLLPVGGARRARRRVGASPGPLLRGRGLRARPPARHRREVEARPARHDARRGGLPGGRGVVRVAAATWTAAPARPHPLRLGPRPRSLSRAGGRRPRAVAGSGPAVPRGSFGGYLLWRLFPERQIFLDGRNELDPGLLREVTTAWTVAPRWQALLARFEIDGALLHYVPRRFRVRASAGDAAGTIEDRTRSRLLFPPADFALVHWDDVAMLFVRRTAARSEAIAAVEYRFVDPEDRPWTVERRPAIRSFGPGSRPSWSAGCATIRGAGARRRSRPRSRGSIQPPTETVGGARVVTREGSSCAASSTTRFTASA